MADRAQSEVVGVVLLVGLVTVAVAVAGGAYLSAVGDEADAGPRTDVRVGVTADAVSLTHNGGARVGVTDLRVVVRRNGTDTGTAWADGTLAGDGDGSFDPGERWRRGGYGFAPTDRVEVLLVHEPTGTLLVRETATPAT